MKEYQQIPVTILDDTQPSGVVSEFVQALLQELMDMVIALVETGASNFLDLKSLPMAPGELEQLQEILGRGEVEATVTALGPTHIVETAIPGVWWVTHKNNSEEVISEFIEVTSLPEILLTQHEELYNSVDIMKGRLEKFEIDP